MKLAEYLRLADEMGIPDLRNGYIHSVVDNWEGELPPSCAIGGAAVAARDFQYESFQIYNRTVLTDESSKSAENVPSAEDWDLVENTYTWCPLRPCQEIKLPITSMVIHLYDDHSWTRTQIADWLDSIEIKNTSVV